MRRRFRAIAVWIAIISVAVVGCAQETGSDISVNFELHAPELNDASKVFIAGSLPSLGNWHPGKVQMKSLGDHRWSFEIRSKAHYPIEYKYTLGSWAKEGADADGRPLPNFAIQPKTDSAAKDEVIFWTCPLKLSVEEEEPMKSFHATLLFLCVLLPTASHSCADDVLPANPLGTLLVFDESPFNGTPRGFYEFDFDTTELSLVTEVAMPTGDQLTGFEWNLIDGLVYAGSSHGNLYTISLGGGELDLIGQVPVAGSPQFIRGITFEPTSNRMFGMGFGPRLYEIDQATANSNEIGLSPDVDGGLAFTSDGRLWGWTPGRKLLEVDPSTASTVQTFSSTLPVMSNITGASDSLLFGVDWQNGGIVEISTATGIGTTIASFPLFVGC